MIKYYICLITALLLFFKVVNAQKHDYHWIHVYSLNAPSNPHAQSNLAVRMDFNQNPKQIYTDSGTFVSWRSELVSMSDSSGNFIFHTNGIQISDRNFQLMPNGDSLNPGIVSSTEPYSLTGHPIIDGAIAIPHPDYFFLYEIFHLAVDTNQLPAFVHRFYRTQVDMRLNNGLGDVTIKNQIWIQDTLCWGQLTATKHANGRDWWVLIPESSGTNGYYSLLVKPDTIEGPFYQQVGLPFIPGSADSDGQASFSPDGTKYARFRDDLFVFDFDRCTGELCNGKYFSVNDLFGGGGCAFSPNNRFLYFATGRELYQVDLYVSDINQGVQNIVSYPWDSFHIESFALMRLAPDNKIYVLHVALSPIFSIIESPNLQGAACNFQLAKDTFALYSPITLPNFPHYRTPAQDSCPPCGTFSGVEVKEEISTVGEDFLLYPNPASNQISLINNSINNKNYQVSIANSIGQVIYKQELNDANTQIDVKEWMNGIYFLTVSLDGVLVGTKSFIVAH